MGLDCTHGAWSGPYSAFNRWRRKVAAACGGSFPGRNFYDPAVVPEAHREGAALFLGHSDCEGILAPAECRKVAAFLRWVAPRVPEQGRPDRDFALQFAAGCERAAAAGEDLLFQ